MLMKPMREYRRPGDIIGVVNEYTKALQTGQYKLAKKIFSNNPQLQGTLHKIYREYSRLILARYSTLTSRKERNSD